MYKVTTAGACVRVYLCVHRHITVTTIYKNWGFTFFINPIAISAPSFALCVATVFGLARFNLQLTIRHQYRMEKREKCVYIHLCAIYSAKSTQSTGILVYGEAIYSKRWAFKINKQLLQKLFSFLKVFSYLYTILFKVKK